MEGLDYLYAYRHKFPDWDINADELVPWVFGFHGTDWMRSCLRFQTDPDAKHLENLRGRTLNLGAAAWACAFRLDDKLAQPALLSLEAKATEVQKENDWQNASHPFREWRAAIQLRVTTAFALKLQDPDGTGMGPTPLQQFVAVTLQCEAGLQFLAEYSDTAASLA
jgi:hypothetical protein